MSGSADAEFMLWAQSRVGTMIRDKYRLDALVGVGAMASVYSATHRNGRRVALRILNPELSRRADLCARFRSDGQVANAVKHVGAVGVIDDDDDDGGSPFLVMELLEGQVIERIWEANRKRLSGPIVLAIAREVCEVLVAAHAAGIVHGDIKPENLYLTNEGQLKILDFGLAHLSSLAHSNDNAGTQVGTPAFMSPEQAAGLASQIDLRTDLWSLGATMFTLLSGLIVHEGDSAQEMVMGAAMKPVRRVAEVLPDAHPAIALVVDRALAYDKDARWPSAASMRDAICAASRTVFGDERLALPRAGDLTVGSAKAAPTAPPAAPAPPPLSPAFAEEDEHTRTDQISLVGTDAFPEPQPESEQTERRARPDVVMDEEPPATPLMSATPLAATSVPPATPHLAWRAESGAVGSGLADAMEEKTQVTPAAHVHEPKVMIAEERTSVMNIDLRNSNSPRASGSFQAPHPSGHYAVQNHPSGPPGPNAKPRPPALARHATPNPRPTAQEPTRVIPRPRQSMLPWMLTATAIAIAIVAIGFALMSRRG